MRIRSWIALVGLLLTGCVLPDLDLETEELLREARLGSVEESGIDTSLNALMDSSLAKAEGEAAIDGLDASSSPDLEPDPDSASVSPDAMEAVLETESIETLGSSRTEARQEAPRAAEKLASNSDSSMENGPARRPSDERTEAARSQGPSGNSTPNTKAVADPPLETPEEIDLGGDISGKGSREIARVGEEVITLSELIAVLKQRIPKLSTDQKAGRRQIIVIARSYMEARIMNALVLQAADSILKDPERLASERSEILARWEQEERPRLQARERAESLEELEGRLARRGQALEDLRAAFEARELARMLKLEEGFEGDDAAYLNRLRERVPITSILDKPPRTKIGSAE